MPTSSEPTTPGPAAEAEGLPTATAQAASPPRVLFPPAVAAVLAFVVQAVVNAVFIARLHKVNAIVRIWHQLIDLGHFLFVGALVGLVVLTWTRLVPKWPERGIVFLGVVGIAVAYFLAREDFAGFASEAGGDRGGPFILGGLLFCAGASLAVNLAAGSRLAALHRALAVALVLAGIGLSVVNGLVLIADYPGVHLLIALNAAVLVAAGVARLPLPSRLQRPTGSRAAPIALAVLGALALPSVVLRPNNEIRTQLTRVEGALLVPLLATTLWDSQETVSVVGVPPELQQWFVDRRKGSPIPPSGGGSLLPKDPIVILIGVDSLRADLFDKADARAKIPNLIAMRDRAVSFSMARSPGSRTITTWSSVFGGRYVSGLRWKGDGNRLSIADDRTKRFTDYLHDEGVFTSSFVSYSALGKVGLSRRFDEVVDIKAREGQLFGLSADVMPKLIEHIEKPHPNGAFYFAHLMDAHEPYDAAKKSGSTRARFLSEVELADRSVGELWTALEEKNLLARTVLFVTADHGEGLGEHDTKFHTVNLYEELIRVPLFVVIPGASPRSVETPVSLMDLGPTILDLFGQPTPSSFLGQSLLPFARGKNPELTRPICAERSGTRAMLFGSKKVLIDKQKGRFEIYDLGKDPEESTNLADHLGAEGAKMIDLAQGYFELHATPW